MRVFGLVLTFILLLACGPSSKERETRAAEIKAREAEEVASKQREAEGLTRLTGIVELTRTHCAAEFERATAENLGPASEGKGCDLPADADLRFESRGAKATLSGAGSAMGGVCDEYVKALDVEVRQTLFKKSSVDNEILLRKLDRTWLVAVVYETYKAPAIRPEIVGGPNTFVPGAITGTGYLYSVRAGKLECVGPVDAKSSTEIETFKRDEKLMADVEGDLAVADNLGRNIGTALKGGRTWPLVAGGYKPPPPPTKAAPKASPTQRKQR